jgi:uncharacterized protein YcbX
MKLLSIHRYPIKSFQGEGISNTSLTTTGVPHDRALALYDVETHSIASRKHPKRYPRIEDLGAFVRDEQIFLRLSTKEERPAEDEETNRWLSDYFQRELRVVRKAPPGAKLHQLWSDVEGLAPEGSKEASTPTNEEDVTADDFAILAPGTLFDAAPLHLVFTSSASRLEKLSQKSFAMERFRPNLIIESEDSTDIIEDSLIGKKLTLGGATLKVVVHSPRCIVPSLATHQLPADKDILRSLVTHQRRDVAIYGSFACFGIYAVIVSPGEIQVGDPLLSH